MSLTLRIQNRERLENGSSLEFVLHRRGGLIGRSATNDWSLPDSNKSGISRRHCEIQYREGRYFLSDLSSNGTFVNDGQEPVQGPHPIAPGDRIYIGDYEIVAVVSGEARETFEREQERKAAEENTGWDDWEGLPSGAAGASAGASGPAAGAAEDWGLPEEAAREVSEWADEAGSGNFAPDGDDIFGSLTNNHQVDWAAASWDAPVPSDEGFGAPADDDGFAPLDDGGKDKDPFLPLNPSADTSDPFSAASASQPSASPNAGRTAPNAAVPSGEENWGTQYPAGRPDPKARPAPPPPTGAQPARRRSQQQAPATPPPAAAQAPDAAYQQLVRYLGVDPQKLSQTPEETAERTARLLHRLLAGLMTLLEARARAKDQMGATATQLRFDGNNPLKFARNVEQALEMTLNPPMRGYMDADRAVEDAFRDLQAHQIATLKAMQGALQATLKRFSPAAIKARTEEKGGLSKLIPGQREAELWKAYEKEFGGVAQGSAEAFLDVFSKEFRQAYEDASRRS